MIIDLSKLRALAEATKLDPYDNLATNNYGISMPPARASELIAEIERHREVNAEGCKPDYNTHPTTSINTKTADGPTQACQENQA